MKGKNFGRWHRSREMAEVRRQEPVDRRSSEGCPVLGNDGDPSELSRRQKHHDYHLHLCSAIIWILSSWCELRPCSGPLLRRSAPTAAGTKLTSPAKPPSPEGNNGFVESRSGLACPADDSGGFCATSVRRFTHIDAEGCPHYFFLDLRHSSVVSSLSIICHFSSPEVTPPTTTTTPPSPSSTLLPTHTHRQHAARSHLRGPRPPLSLLSPSRRRCPLYHSEPWLCSQGMCKHSSPIALAELRMLTCSCRSSSSALRAVSPF